MAAGVLAACAWSLAYAHSGLVKSQPARRATISQSPSEIKLWFSEPLEPAYASAQLQSVAGAAVATAVAAVDPVNPKLLRLGGVPVLAPGAYVVRYRVLSIDGHTVESRIEFQVGAAAPGR